MFKTHLFRCTLLLISILVMACARTITITCHSTLDGVLKISVHNRAQVVAMATKHPDILLIYRRNPYLDAHSF